MVASRGCPPLPPSAMAAVTPGPFGPLPLCPIESEAVAGRASQNALPLLRAGAHCPRSSGLQPCLITVMGVPGCRRTAGVGCWGRGRQCDGTEPLTRAFPHTSSPVSSAITRPCGPVTVTACRPSPSSRSQCAEWLTTAFACEWVWQLWSSRRRRARQKKKTNKRSGGIGSLTSE